MLGDPSIPREKAELRAVALQILGEAFMAVKKDDGSSSLGEESEYVKVETKSSRARADQGGTAGSYSTAPKANANANSNANARARQKREGPRFG